MTADVGAALREFRERARGPETTVTTYGPEPPAGLAPLLEQFDVAVVHRSLSIPPSEGYLTVRAGDRYRGSVSTAAFGEAGGPGGRAPWDTDGRAAAYRDLVALLSGASFEMDEKRSLVATAREIEERAWRAGAGTLYASFQSLSAFRAQLPVYERLVESTDLRVVAFGAPDWDPPAVEGVTVHRDDAGDLTDFWVVAFHGGGDDDRKCAMVAEETSPGTFAGVVTYDPDLVDELTACLAGVLDGGEDP